jgi:NAD(P)H-flavin reductase
VFFHEFKVGDTILLDGPMGDDLIIDKTKENVVLIAGGIGITPFVTIVEDLVKNPGNVKDVTLIYGVQKEEDIIFRDHFDKLASNKSFTFIPVVEKPHTWKGETGFVTNVLNKMELKGSSYYMCGPLAMADASEKLLIESGVDKKDIHIESA